MTLQELTRVEEVRELEGKINELAKMVEQLKLQKDKLKEAISEKKADRLIKEIKEKANDDCIRSHSVTCVRCSANMSCAIFLTYRELYTAKEYCNITKSNRALIHKLYIPKCTIDTIGYLLASDCNRYEPE